MSFSILTVGDGDLSCSLALKRAYGNQIRVVPSTLLCEEELRATYLETASHNIDELGKGSIQYNVDATQLHRQTFFPARVDQDRERFDAILFHHPHLGIYFETEEEHAQQHISLISHYLDSARHLLKPGGRIHLCLCGNQALDWRLQDTCHWLGLQVTESFPASQPLFTCLLACRPSASWKAPRRFRSGKMGSKHWLSNFGYRHQLTFPQKGRDSRYLNAAVSTHYFIKPLAIEGNLELTDNVDDMDASLLGLTCHICRRPFDTKDALKRHLESPARPPKYVQEFSKEILTSDGAFESRVGKVTEEKPRMPKETNASSDNARTGSSQRQFTVSNQHSGKRLRWFLHQVAQLGSKKHCEKFIQSGRVTVRGLVVTDSSRVLVHNDMIRLEDGDMAGRTRNSTYHDAGIRPVASWSNDRCVVWKPVGMRTAGGFDPTSLESSFSLTMGTPYIPVTKLDRGCSGLVVLEKLSAPPRAELDVALGFTILVHGLMPTIWSKGIFIDLPVHALRRWKKMGTPPTETQDSAAKDKAKLVLIEQTDALCYGRPLPALSTVHLTTGSSISGLASVICYCLRKDYGFPVVGDRFASEEYMKLPRSMRQRIKHRLCMGCTTVMCLDEPQFHAQQPLFYKWSAQHWQDHLTSQAPS